MSRRLTEQIADLVYEWIQERSEEELHNLIPECASRTETNCGWVAYGLRYVVRELAENELRLRKKAAEQRNEPDVSQRGFKATTWVQR